MPVIKTDGRVLTKESGLAPIAMNLSAMVVASTDQGGQGTNESADVRFWHLTDITIVLPNVRFWG